MKNSNRIEIFKKVLEISKKYFKTPKSEIYDYNDRMEIIWSDDTVKTIFELSSEKRVAVLSFADGDTPGGLVWQGVKTQEEDLCRASNLYIALDTVENLYPINGKLIYSKDVVFFRDDKLRSPHKVDVISCPAPINSSLDAERRMRMIIEAARLNGVEILVLGRWGCGAFGNDWKEYKKLWDKVIGTL